jgi:DNA-binding CsgD family transcriptional regulator
MSEVLFAFADCVASLHEAALAPEHWPEALEASMRLFGATGILLTDVDREQGTPRSIQTAGHDPALLDAYAGYYASIDPTIAVGMGGAHGTVYHLRAHFSESQMRRMEYFQDFLFAFGVSDVMATPLDYAPEARLFLSLQRRTGEPSFELACHPLLERFSRQLNIAKQTEDKLRKIAENNSELTAGLDAFAGAMFMVDAKARLRQHNRAAAALLTDSVGVTTHSGHLRLSETTADARLTHAIRVASKPRGMASAFVIKGMSGTVLQALVTPLHPAHQLVGHWQEPLVLVIISDTGHLAALATQKMRELYDLTRAESRLVAEIADGKTLREISDLREVSMATLRTQLLTAFGKTGVHRQVDLVRLVGALAPIANLD